MLKKSWLDFLKGGDESFKWGSVRSALRPRSIMGVQFRELFKSDEVIGNRGEASLELPLRFGFAFSFEFG